MGVAMDLLDDLRTRGLLHDSTDPDELSARLKQRPIGIYVGFDPTADSLHVGHLLGQLMLRRFQLAGHRPIALAGGATGMVGDPSGRSDERNLLDADTLRHNVDCIETQLRRLLDFEPGAHAASLVNNLDWTARMGVLDFLRDVGKHATVNQMVAKDSVRSRMAGTAGISFTEFSYMLLQANDFRHLAEHHGVELQGGGSDQWGNITQGIDLIRRSLSRVAYGLTWPLLTKSDGTKFGKSSTGTVWLDPAKTSPFQFRQFWISAEDTDVERLLRQFTLLDVTDIDALVAEHSQAPQRRLAHRRLAREVTTLVHGPDAWVRADHAADLLFGGDPTAADDATFVVLADEIPTSAITPAGLAAFDAPGLLVHTGLASSLSDARRGLSQRAYSLNGTKLDVGVSIGVDHWMAGRWVLLSRGRKFFHLVQIVE
jgi:tyrosyl-tRNA synthetase